ncbi:hydroxyisourate hydrolase [Paracoccidioides brasiliensis Pb03]|uniref:Hydroxyisourate hydrolase n=1 Tax=Paracoccidioides brasiliensis (strain Pb18) TaxID=502780 RepID=C1G181_PARBD|nr:hydroxyisourate hydrolase [Paracoccidioides brasiliensis Pb18]EEH19961.1 hydroxyisourate hydrolase [Paracoccidioides brasiliensis Pb03]EEH44332.1 hydroxyisourate hydrolase [Paracoccidioides brasiliensis Pb18]ODH53507.1 hydroxyisourate hydrolase [Paracoccidioides brasiliensis]
MSHRDPITCHILNTINGTPASGLSCTLTLHRILLPPGAPQPPNLPATLHAATDADGRVKTWTPSSSTSTSTSTSASTSTIRELLSSIHEHHGGQQRSIWSLRVRNVGEWYAEQGVESFWPEVEVRFLVKGSEAWDGWRHYHVPVLLGPWNYSTYRGS